MYNLYFAICYTLLLLIVAYLYWLAGRKKGINETVAVIALHEPQAIIRVKLKLEGLLNDTDVKQ